MRHVAKSMLLLFSLGFAFNAFSQEVDPLSKGFPLEEGKILTEYEASEGVTLVRLEPLFLYYKEVPAGQVIKDWLNMMAAFSYKGKKPVVPSNIMLGFGSSSEKGCKFPNSLDFEITFVVDGEPTKIDSVFSFNEPATDGSCTESLMAKLAVETFIKISRANKVEMQMGDTKIEMKDYHLKALRNFAKKMMPSK